MRYYKQQNNKKGTGYMATTRRKKGTGQITYIEGRKSPWRITFLGNYTETGIRKQRTKYFSSESAAKAFLRDLNRTEKQRKEFVQDGVMFNALIPAYLNEKKEQGLKTRSERYEHWIDEQKEILKRDSEYELL